MLDSRKVEIATSKHIDFGMYGSDTRFMFTGADGRTYIQGIDFDNGRYSGKTVKENGKLFFHFMSNSRDI
ncbi:MAG: hypothetical protein NTU57_05295 [Candidatus Aenigmarchaeota archaeon]|nr:hypothetical protein [Candidatus Aenigmarchaeota archaeon]